MDLYDLIQRPKKRSSVIRRNLFVSTYEGIPALVVYTILGVPFLTGYLLYLGANSLEVGIVLAFPYLANVVQIAAAFLMQKFDNRRRIYIFFGSLHRLLWTATGLIPFLFPQSLWVAVYILLYVAAFLSNSINAAYWTSLISDMVPGRVRGKYFGIRNTVLWGVASLTLFIGGQVMDWYPGETGFVILFSISAVFSVLNILAMWFYPDIPIERSLESNPGRMLLLPFRNGVFFKAMMFISAWMLLQGIVVPFFSYVMIDIMHISYYWVSIITMVQTIVMMISYYIWGLLNSRYATRTLLLWTFPLIALSSLTWCGVMIVSPIAVLFVVHILLGIGQGGFNLLVFNFTIGDTPKSERPMFIAVFSSVTGLAGFVGPLIGGYLYEWIETAPVWMRTFGLSTGAGLVLMLFALVIGPYVFKDRQASKAGLPLNGSMRIGG